MHAVENVPPTTANHGRRTLTHVRCSDVLLAMLGSCAIVSLTYRCAVPAAARIPPQSRSIAPGCLVGSDRHAQEAERVSHAAAGCGIVQHGRWHQHTDLQHQGECTYGECKK